VDPPLRAAGLLRTIRLRMASSGVHDLFAFSSVANYSEKLGKSKKVFRSGRPKAQVASFWGPPFSLVL